MVVSIALPLHQCGLPALTLDAAERYQDVDRQARRYLDAATYPETHRVSPWIRVLLTAVNETVFVRSAHEPGRVYFRRARRIEEEEPIPAPGGYQ